MTFNIGDTVEVTKRLNPTWSGQGVVTEDRHNVLNHTYVQMTTGWSKGLRGHFPTAELVLVQGVVPEDPDVMALGKAIDALRKKGWGVEVKVTEPPTTPKTYTL